MTRPALPRRDPRETLPDPSELTEGERALLDWLAAQIVRDVMKEQQCDEAA